MARVHTVEINGSEMDYFTFGKGEKTFVILPGLSVQSVMGAKDAVEEGFQIMQDDFTVCLFDRKKNVPESYSIFDMADDTALAMKTLGLKDVYLFGASQGGMIAMVIAIRYPELVRKLVLGSTSAHVKSEQCTVLNRWISLAVQKDADGLYQAFGEAIYPPVVYEQFKDYFSETAKTVTNEELERFVILAGSIRGFDVTDELARIDCPVLLLGATDDPVLGADAAEVIAARLNGRSDFSMYMYTGYGHAAFDTAPDYRQRILDFFMGDKT